MLRNLSIEQSNFAGENYALVEAFLKGKKLSYDEYHDVVIFSYLKAAQDYLEKDTQNQYTFRRVAFKSMLSALNSHYRKRNRNRRIAVEVSLEHATKGSGSLIDNGISYVNERDLLDDVMYAQSSTDLNAA